MIKKIIYFCLFYYTLLSAQVVGPILVPTNTKFDFMNVKSGASISHTFILYNGGDIPLTLYGLRSSCNCIKAKLDKNELLPADSAKLKILYKKDNNSSHIDNFVTLQTNDPLNPKLRIYVTRKMPGQTTLSGILKDSTGKALSKPEIFFPVLQHNFGRIKEGEIVDYIFKFYNEGDAPLIIQNITTSCGCTAASVTGKNIAPEKEGELKVQFDSSYKTGKLSRIISIYSNDPIQRVRPIIIFADILKAGK